MPRWMVGLLLALVGAAAGIAYGRLVAPVQYVDTVPASLRIDYRTDYVLMVAERFHADHDAETAMQQLSLLGAQSADAVSGEALAFARSVSYAGPDLALLEELNRAMQALAPLPSPVGTP